MTIDAKNVNLKAGTWYQIAVAPSDTETLYSYGLGVIHFDVYSFEAGPLSERLAELAPSVGLTVEALTARVIDISEFTNTTTLCPSGCGKELNPIEAYHANIPGLDGTAEDLSDERVDELLEALSSMSATAELLVGIAGGAEEFAKAAGISTGALEAARRAHIIKLAGTAKSALTLTRAARGSSEWIVRDSSGNNRSRPVTLGDTVVAVAVYQGKFEVVSTN